MFNAHHRGFIDDSIVRYFFLGFLHEKMYLTVFLRGQLHSLKVGLTELSDNFVKFLDHYNKLLMKHSHELKVPYNFILYDRH